MIKNQHFRISLMLIICQLLLFLPKYSPAQKYVSGHFEYQFMQGAGFTYKIDLLLYVHSDSLMPDSVKICPGSGYLCSKKIGLSETKAVGNNILLYRYSTFHTYPGPFFYTLHYLDSSSFRSALNLPNKIPYYLDARIVATDFSWPKANTSATLYDKPPVLVQKGKPFAYNICAEDYDSPYHFVGNDLLFEWLLKDSSHFIPQGVQLNERSGEVTWENPTIEGVYDFSIKVTERKNGMNCGYIVKNIVLQVVDSLNTDPVFQYIQNWQTDTAGYYVYHLQPNQNLQLFFSYKDSQADSIGIYAYSETFNMAGPATFTHIVGNTHYGLFEWTPDATHIRQHPYLLYFIAFSELPDGTVYHHYITVMLYVNAPLSAAVDSTIEEKYNAVKVYPNPTNDYLNIAWEAEFDFPIELKISDVSGRIIVHQTLKYQTGNTTLDVSSLANGIYTIQLLNNKTNVYEKFCKQQ